MVWCKIPYKAQTDKFGLLYRRYRCCAALEHHPANQSHERPIQSKRGLYFSEPMSNIIPFPKPARTPAPRTSSNHLALFRKQKSRSAYIAHSLMLEGIEFQCVISRHQGPILMGYHDGVFLGSVELGCAHLCDTKKGMAICKYRDPRQPRINVATLTLESLMLLREHFGVEFWAHCPPTRVRDALVHASLQAWAKAHPRLLKNVPHVTVHAGAWLEPGVA